MKKIISNLKIIAAVFALFACLVAVASPQVSQANDLDLWGGDQVGSNTYVADTTGLGEQDPRIIASQVIRVMLGFLGIIAVVIILLGGFKWMTAAGNEDKVDEAKKLIGAGVIGLVIILASYGIANFVLNALVSATVGE